MEEKLNETGHPDHTLKTFPGLGHLFSPPTDGWIPNAGPWDPGVIQWITDWTYKKFLQRESPQY